MKISIICFSLNGLETGRRLLDGLSLKNHQVTFYRKSKYLPGSVPQTAREWAGEQFQEADALIFVGACGIAVRSIAPHIRGKKQDPAVLVADECGKFVISLLSGHLGGANELAQEAAGVLDAVPVVTTATDLHQQFAVDVFAKKNLCAIFFMDAAREASAALLAGERIGFYSEFPWDGELPGGLVVCDERGMPVQKRYSGEKELPLATGVAVTIHKYKKPFSFTVHVVPRVLSLGVGCRKGKNAEDIFLAVNEAMDRQCLYRAALGNMASISLKKNEAGLKALEKELRVPFFTYDEKELRELSGEFTASPFVKQVTGVDNVCERSAVLASGGGRLIQKKQGGSGVTTALAVKEWRIHFE